MDLKDYFNGGNKNKYTYVRPYMRRNIPNNKIKIDKIIITLLLLGVIALPFILNPKLILIIAIPVILITILVCFGKRKRIIAKIKIWFSGNL